MAHKSPPKTKTRRRLKRKPAKAGRGSKKGKAAKGY